jgi:hypothetical protein
MRGYSVGQHQESPQPSFLHPGKLRCLIPFVRPRHDRKQRYHDDIRQQVFHIGFKPLAFQSIKTFPQFPQGFCSCLFNDDEPGFSHHFLDFDNLCALFDRNALPAESIPLRTVLGNFYAFILGLSITSENFTPKES